MRKTRNPRTPLAALALAACLPYLALKITWLSGGRTGIPEGSTLLSGGSTLWLLNAVTVAMDATVVLLVFALTRPWGRRLPAPVIAFPLWCASGLLGPIAVAFPVQALLGLFTEAGSSGGTGSGAAGPALLDPWVRDVVYTGFTLQALALGGLFVLYVRDRWGPLLRTRTTALPLPRGGRVRARTRVAWSCGALIALASAVPTALWAAGSTVGLSPARAAQSGPDSNLASAAFLLFALVALVGTGRLVHDGPGPRGPRLRVPLAAAWTGTAVMTCWGAWLLLGSLSGGGETLGAHTTPLLLTTYSTQTVAGLLLTAVTLHALHHRIRTHTRSPGAAAEHADKAAGRHR